MTQIVTLSHDVLVNEALADKIIEVIKEVSPHSTACRTYNPSCDVFGHPVIAVLVGGHRILEIRQLPQGSPNA